MDLSDKPEFDCVERVLGVNQQPVRLLIFCMLRLLILQRSVMSYHTFLLRMRDLKDCSSSRSGMLHLARESSCQVRKTCRRYDHGSSPQVAMSNEDDLVMEVESGWSVGLLGASFGCLCLGRDLLR